ncbi:MAG: acyltransferase [Promethearchaeota archaeon]
MKKNIWEIEILRGFAIFTVVIFHVTFFLTSISILSPLIIVLMFLNVLFGFGVPLFIFLSGFVLSFRYHHSKNYSLLHFYKKRFLILLPPYFIAAIVYMIYFKNYEILSIFYPQSVSPHFWYIPLIMFFYILYPLFSKIVHKFTKRASLVITIFFIVQFISIIIEVLFKLPSILEHSGYFILGMYVYEYYEKFKEKVRINYKILIKVALLILISIIIHTYVFYIVYINRINFNNNRLFYIFYTVSFAYVATIVYTLLILLLLFLALNIKERSSFKRSIFSNLGKYSYGIFLYHYVILLVFYDIFIMLGFNREYYLFYIILFLASIASSTLLIYLISLLPFHQYAIGKIRKYQKRNKLMIFENYILYSSENYYN